WPTCTLKAKTLPNNIRSILQLRHQTPHVCLVNNRHLFGFLPVLLANFTPLQHRGLHRAEVSWSNAGGHRERHILTTLGRMSLHKNLVAVVVETERNVAHDRC